MGDIFDTNPDGCVCTSACDHPCFLRVGVTDTPCCEGCAPLNKVTRERALQEALDLIAAEDPCLVARISARVSLFGVACKVAGAPNGLHLRTSEEMEAALAREAAWRAAA